jgi:hypothetical protein
MGKKRKDKPKIETVYILYDEALIDLQEKRLRLKWGLLSKGFNHPKKMSSKYAKLADIVDSKIKNMYGDMTYKYFYSELAANRINDEENIDSTIISFENFYSAYWGRKVHAIFVDIDNFNKRK